MGLPAAPLAGSGIVQGFDGDGYRLVLFATGAREGVGEVVNFVDGWGGAESEGGKEGVFGN